MEATNSLSYIIPWPYAAWDLVKGLVLVVAALAVLSAAALPAAATAAAEVVFGEDLEDTGLPLPSIPNPDNLASTSDLFSVVTPPRLALYS